MNQTFFHRLSLPFIILHCCALALIASRETITAADRAKPAERKLLYVAEPGIRDYLEHGGHGVLVYDIDDGHKFVKRIPARGVNEQGKPLNVKGVCASATTKRLYQDGLISQRDPPIKWVCLTALR